MLATNSAKWQKNEWLMFTFNQWIGIHGAICTAIVFADQEKEKIELKRILNDIENFLLREQIIERHDLAAIHKVLASKRAIKKARKWLKKR